MFFDLVASLMVGFIGSVHCLGMCGPLIMAYSLHIRKPGDQLPPRAQALWVEGTSHHLAFHLGRLFTYGLLGGLAAGAVHVVGFSQLFFNLRSSISLGGGILMVVFGFMLLKVLPVSLRSLPSLGSGTFFSRILSPLFQSRRLGSRLLLGLAAGFLPCMLSWAMIVKAATTQGFLTGFGTMVFFGLGTFPALFLTGLSASLLSLRIRVLGERVAAISVIVMGFILVFKGARYFV
jgi:sulfite exporter TauE/SafE